VKRHGSMCIAFVREHPYLADHQSPQRDKIRQGNTRGRDKTGRAI